MPEELQNRVWVLFKGRDREIVGVYTTEYAMEEQWEEQLNGNFYEWYNLHCELWFLNKENAGGMVKYQEFKKVE